MGPMTRTVRDCALLLDAIAGFDPADPTSRRGPGSSATSLLDKAPAKLSIGVVEAADGDGVAEDVRATVDRAAVMLADAGFTMRPVALPHADHAARALMTFIYAEASSFHREFLRDRPEGYAERTRDRLEIGSMLPATLYLSAQRARARIVAAYEALFREIDLLLLPVMSIASYRLDSRVDKVESGPDGMIAGVRYEGPFNVTGQPAISVPAGSTGDGLPIGVQLAGRPFEEATLLQAAQVLERLMSDFLPPREGNPLVV
jgi:aspartyl-tRNA(Asn)/glutamyl-tRNA(Gln) amidotransferase subunit A